MKLTLIRHGLTQGNLCRLYYGATDLSLAPEGISQLQQLSHTHIYPTAQHYCTSGLARTEETLALLYGKVPHTPIPDLREVNFGDWEMKCYDDLKDDPSFQQWCCGEVSQHICPNGESFLQVQQRALRAMQPILNRDEDTVCIIHGGVISFLLQAWFPADANISYARTPQPGFGYQIIFTSGIPETYETIPFSPQHITP